MSAEIPSWLAAKVAFEGRYASIPECTKYSLKMWVLYAQMPGGFVEALLRNDLHGAFDNADSGNLAALELIMSWIHNECPGNCWLAPGNHPFVQGPDAERENLNYRDAARKQLYQFGGLIAEEVPA